MANAAPTHLTARERTILHQLALGKTNTEIAAALFITSYTSREYIARLYAKMGVNRRSELIARALDLGLLTIVMKE